MKDNGDPGRRAPADVVADVREYQQVERGSQHLVVEHLPSRTFWCVQWNAYPEADGLPARSDYGRKVPENMRGWFRVTSRQKVITLYEDATPGIGEKLAQLRAACHEGVRVEGNGRGPAPWQVSICSFHSQDHVTLDAAVDEVLAHVQAQIKANDDPDWGC